MTLAPGTECLEIHDAGTLAKAREVLAACASPADMQQEVLAAVDRNERWRGRECLNLLAPEALVSPTVRKLLSRSASGRRKVTSAR